MRSPNQSRARQLTEMWPLPVDPVVWPSCSVMVGLYFFPLLSCWMFPWLVWLYRLWPNPAVHWLCVSPCVHGGVCVCARVHRPGWAASCSAFCHAQCEVEPIVGCLPHWLAQITPDHLFAAVSCLTYHPLAPRHRGTWISSIIFLVFSLVEEVCKKYVLKKEKIYMYI